MAKHNSGIVTIYKLEIEMNKISSKLQKCIKAVKLFCQDEIFPLKGQHGQKFLYSVSSSSFVQSFS